MSFSNLFSAFKTSFDENSNVKSDVFAISKLFVIEKVNKSSINLFQLFDNQYVLYLLKNSEKVEIFLT